MMKTFSNDNQIKATFYALLSVIAWSTIATAFKIALNSAELLIVLFLSTFTSLLIYFFILLVKNKFCIKIFFKITLREMIYSAFLGFLNPFCYYIILFKAYSILPAHIAQPLNYTWPFVLTIFSSFMLKEKIKINSLTSIIICVIGIFFLSLSAQKYNSGNSLLGVILAISSSIIWAFYWLFNKKDNRKSINKLFYNFFFAFLYVSVLLFLKNSNFYYTLNIKSAISSIYIGIFEMGVTFILWLKALELTNRSDSISIYIYLSPVFSLFFIIFILKEHFSMLSVVGILLIFAGIIKLNYSTLKTLICAGNIK